MGGLNGSCSGYHWQDMRHHGRSGVGVAVWAYFAVVFLIALAIGGDNGSTGIVAGALGGLVGLFILGWGVATELEGSPSNVGIL